MGVEIERKFLLRSDAWRAGAGEGVTMKQGYFAGVPGESPTVRVRIAGARAFLTIKGEPNGLARSEFEYEIPVADAEAMLREFCGTRVVEKCRYTFPAGDGLFWEVDEYFGLNEGLFTAEIELPTADAPCPHPEWLGEEVSGNPAYTNGALSRRPWRLRRRGDILQPGRPPSSAPCRTGKRLPE